VRGSKGSKVLRTRKIKQHHNEYYDVNRAWNYFCSQGCQNDFWNVYGNQIRQIAPRLEPLETKINDPKKKEHEGWGGRIYYSTEITKVDNAEQ
jgi:hypothetical protein